MITYRKDSDTISIIIDAIWDCNYTLQQKKSDINIKYHISETSYSNHSKEMMINLEGYTYIIPNFTPIYEVEHCDASLFITAIKQYLLNDNYCFRQENCFAEVFGLAIIVNYLLKRNENRHIKLFAFIFGSFNRTKNIDGIIDIALKLLVFQIDFKLLQEKYSEYTDLYICEAIPNTPKCIF